MSFVRVLLLLAALAVPARAGTVGVVAIGDPDLQATLSMQLEGWLRTHGHQVGETLPADATGSLINCMVIDDEACARGVIDSRAKTESVVFAEARKPKTRASKATTLSVYWLVKGKAPVGMKRACEDCNDDLMKSTLDEMLRAVIGASELPRGRLSLHSKPEGVTVLLDNAQIGITPLEREVPAGEHTIVLMSNGRKVGERRVKIEPEVTAEITMTVTEPSDIMVVERPSRVVPGVALALGGTAIVVGAVLYLTSDKDDGTKPEYYDNRPVGIGVAAGGVALTALGAYLWIRAGSEQSTPIVAIERDGGYVGWARAF